MRGIVEKIVVRELKLPLETVKKLLEVPSSDSLGDYAFPCFSFAHKYKKKPVEIAEEFSEKLKKRKFKGISIIEARKGYLNFFVDRNMLAGEIFSKVEAPDFGLNASGKNKKIVIDMSSPNIAKPFGIGHLRSTIIGNSISKICEANGYEVTKINYLGDWGTQFGKVILGFKQFGDEKLLKEDPIGHLYELYVKMSGEKYDDDAREEFSKLEAGDKENLKLWKRFRKVSLEEFSKIYELLGIKFDVFSGESEYNNKMDSVIKKLKSKKLLKKDEGAEIVDLKKDGLSVALIQKGDGTSLYVTRDLAAAIDRKAKYKFDRMIYEVGGEQRLHFRQVFKILDKLGYSWSKNCVHAAHGLYLDKDGKKFSTRKGKTIFMKDILDEVIEKARANLASKNKLSKKELDFRAQKIALSAIYYGDLKTSRESNMVFDVDKFLSFEGDTGPYLLYSYARANSILTKVKPVKKFEMPFMDEAEFRLLKKIGAFPEIVIKAYANLAPNLIANYSFELAQLFNEFYHSSPVLGSKSEGFRLKLVDSFRMTLKKSLGILGIDVLDEM